MDISFQLLRQQNPWWFREELIEDDEKILDFEQQSLKYLPPLLQEFPDTVDAILTVRGPRQIGKSTTMKLIIRKLLLEKKVPRQSVFYFSLDMIEDFNQLHELLVCWLCAVRPGSSRERLYIFLDEISFVREWQRAVKMLADQGKLNNITLLLTGSNLLDVEQGAERMPGRRGRLDKLDYEHLPLSFADYIGLTEKAIDRTDPAALHYHQDLLVHRFEEYLLVGGFPLAVNLFNDTGHISSWVYQLYLSWIEGDMGRVGKQERNLHQIMSRILAHQSSAVSWLGLGREAGIASHATVQEYVEILEKMYVLQVVPFMDISTGIVRWRKNRKIYFQDPLIFHCFSGKNNGIGDCFYTEARRFLADPVNKSQLVESVVAFHLQRAFGSCSYWQGKKEIDFVVQQDDGFALIEVKYREQVRFADFTKYKSMIAQHGSLLVATRHHHLERDGVRMVPVPVFLIQLEYQKPEARCQKAEAKSQRADESKILKS